MLLIKKCGCRHCSPKDDWEAFMKKEPFKSAPCCTGEQSFRCSVSPEFYKGKKSKCLVFPKQNFFIRGTKNRKRQPVCAFEEAAQAFSTDIKSVQKLLPKREKYCVEHSYVPIEAEEVDTPDKSSPEPTYSVAFQTDPVVNYLEEVYTFRFFEFIGIVLGVFGMVMGFSFWGIFKFLLKGLTLALEKNANRKKELKRKIISNPQPADEALEENNGEEDESVETEAQNKTEPENENQRGESSAARQSQENSKKEDNVAEQHKPKNETKTKIELQSESQQNEANDAKNESQEDAPAKNENTENKQEEKFLMALRDYFMILTFAFFVYFGISVCLEYLREPFANSYKVEIQPAPIPAMALCHEYRGKLAIEDVLREYNATVVNFKPINTTELFAIRFRSSKFECAVSTNWETLTDPAPISDIVLEPRSLKNLRNMTAPICANSNCHFWVWVGDMAEFGEEVIKSQGRVFKFRAQGLDADYSLKINKIVPSVMQSCKLRTAALKPCALCSEATEGFCCIKRGLKVYETTGEELCTKYRYRVLYRSAERTFPTFKLPNGSFGLVKDFDTHEVFERAARFPLTVLVVLVSSVAGSAFGINFLDFLVDFFCSLKAKVKKRKSHGIAATSPAPRKPTNSSEGGKYVSSSLADAKA